MTAIRDRFVSSTALVVLCIGVFFGANAQALPYTGLVVFGDSLADTGNNALFFDTFGAGFPTPVPPGSRTPTPIAGPTFIPTLPYASNRYSNGPVWVDYFAASLGLPLTPSLAGGNNYAFGGARVGPSGSGFPFSLLDQTTQYLAPRGNVAPSSNLYVVAGGGNDARDIFAAAAGGASQAVINGLIGQFVINVDTIVSQLLAAGARDLLLVNIPDIGKTPAIQALSAINAGLPGLASFIADSMNDALDFSLAALLKPPGTQLFELDAFALVDSLVANPAAYGLTDVTSACAAKVACVAEPDTTLFWDGIHPTTAAHRIIAQAALNVIPEPATSLLLLLGVAGLMLHRRAKHAR